MSHFEYDERGRLLCDECDAEAGCYPERVQPSCVCGETSCRNCPEHSEPRSGPRVIVGYSGPDPEVSCFDGPEEQSDLREATLFRLRRLSRHLCSQAAIDPGDEEYMIAPCWVRD